MNEYSKKSGFREPIELLPTTQSKAIPSEQLPCAPKGYFKEVGTQEPAYFCVIISGGEKREKQYLQPFRQLNIKIEFVSPKKNYPEGLCEKAIEKKAEYSLTAPDASCPDSYFIVTDVDDHYRKKIIEISPYCKANNIVLIVSNPCFEIWLYYGKYSSKPIDFKTPHNSLKISSEYKTYLDKSVAGGIDPRKAISDIDTAILNAKTNYELDTDNIPVLFATNMFVLAEELRKHQKNIRKKL